MALVEPMGSFEIGLFITQELHDWCANNSTEASGGGYAAQDISADFIEGAFNRMSNHSVNVKKEDKLIDAPTENLNSDFRARYPCDRKNGTGDAKDWASLRSWFKEWYKNSTCFVPHVLAKDCAILLTNATGGGSAFGQFATAGGSRIIAEKLSSYSNWGSANGTSDSDPDAWNKVDTLLEEIGHSLTIATVYMNDNDGSSNSGDGRKDHDNGALIKHPAYNDEYYAITPIGITADTDYNNCGDYVQKSRWMNDANGTVKSWEAKWSTCTASYFQEK